MAHEKIKTLQQKQFNDSIVRFAFAFILSVFLCSNVAATVYYVSPSGNNSNNGTSTSTPWQTIAKVNSTALYAGDQVLFQGGQTFTGNIVLYYGGTATNLIKIGSYGTGRAYINATSGTGIRIYNKGGVWVDNLIIYGYWNQTNQSGNTGYGISFYTDTWNNFKHQTANVSNCDISGFKNGGVVFGAYPSDGTQSGYNNINVWSNTLHDNGDCGVSSYGYYPAASGSTTYAHTDVYIGWNTTYNNFGVKNKGNNSGNGIVMGDVKDCIIENNVAYNNGWYSNFTGGGPVGIWVWDATNVTIQYNESHHNGTGSGTPDGGGFDLDGAVTNSKMQYNYSHDNWGAGYLLFEFGVPRGNNKNNTVRYNISQNDGTNNSYTGLYIGGNCTNNNFYNNSIYTNKGPCVYVGGGNTNNFINNIFYTAGSSNYAMRIQTNNCWFFNNNYFFTSAFQINYNNTTYTSLASFRSSTGHEKLNGVNYGYSVNPSFNSAGNGGNINSGTPASLNNYKLNAGSPMINTAYNISSWYSGGVGSRDFKGVTIPNNGAYDIGACEYSSTGARMAPSAGQVLDINSVGPKAVYPNPFNNELFIPVTLDNKAKVQLTIFSVKGEVISVVEYGVLEKGTHLLKWDASQSKTAITPGAYTYRLNAGGEISTGKLLKR
ncbi:MAG: T9SS type A sorting domain-containing protein [Bacteroidia bacterium]|nr:T9SS type A sorting domain-containing protein [Bacteroidia bacterium]